MGRIVSLVTPQKTRNYPEMKLPCLRAEAQTNNVTVNVRHLQGDVLKYDPPVFTYACFSALGSLNIITGRKK